jgi:predicted esterase YcpF (UPF0227 family)
LNLEGRLKIIYLHGFNSSSNSKKAKIFKNSKFVVSSGIKVFFPDLPVSPKEAIKNILGLAKSCDFKVSLIGSSLGGFYSTYIADTYNLKSININPVVPSHLKDMKDLIGNHRNYHSDESYLFSQDMYEYLHKIKIKKLKYPLNHLSLIQLEDEVLNHFKTLSYYKNSNLCVEKDGSHEYKEFEEKIPLILDFLL